MKNSFIGKLTTSCGNGNTEKVKRPNEMLNSKVIYMCDVDLDT